jgi:hypothetical protein
MADLPSQSIAKRLGTDMPVSGRSDEEVCKQILELDPAIRVAAFVDSDEVTAFAQSARASSVLSDDSRFKTNLGYWVKIVVELAKQTGNLFGATESVSVNHKRLKLVIVPLSEERTLGLSIDKSADTDNIVFKVTNMPGIKRTVS